MNQFPPLGRKPPYFYGSQKWDIVVRAIAVLEEGFKKSKSENKKCNCSMQILMAKGCQCGGI